MKVIIRSITPLLFLIVLALPALGQNPNVAVRVNAPGSTKKNCFPVTITNLRTTPINATGALLVVVDQSNCKTVCEMKIPLSKVLSPCKPLSFAICCSKAFPSTYIAYVKVTHSMGTNEGWYFNP